MVGLHGTGKTSSCAKLARYYQKKGLKPAVICADVYRPAAAEQLRQLCEKIGVPFYDGANLPEREKGVMGIVNAGVKEFEKYDVKIIDTAGRHALEKEMIKEIEDIKKAINPEQRFLVLDASIGQQASVQAHAFDDAIGITGIIITKMDGTAKGGGALSAVAETNSGVAFIGTGEKTDDFERFEPDGFISRLLGMGDIKSLIETAEASLKPEMLPLGGLGLGLDVNLDDTIYQVTEDKLKRYKVMMDSMTEEELTEPKIIDGSRTKRIARGSGTTIAEVNELIKYHRMMQKMMKGLTSGRGGGKMRGMKMPMSTSMGKMMKRMK